MSFKWLLAGMVSRCCFGMSRSWKNLGRSWSLLGLEIRSLGLVWVSYHNISLTSLQFKL